MNKIIIALLLLMASVNYGQKEALTYEHKLYRNQVIVTGKVDDTSETLKIGNNRISILEDGTFRHKMEVEAPIFISLTHGRMNIPLYLCAKDSLFIDLTDIDIMIKGVGSKSNVFLQEHKKFAKENSSFLDKNNSVVFSLELAPFNAKIDSLESTEVDLLKEFETGNSKISNDFARRLNIDIAYRNNRYRLLYPHNYHRHHKLEKLAPVSSSYYEEVLKGSLANPELLASKDYVRCLNYYFDILGSGEYKFHNLEFVPKKRLKLRYQAIVDSKAERDIKDFFLGEHFQQNIWTYSVKALEESYQAFQTDCKNEEIKKKVSDLIQIGQNRRNDADDIKVYRKIEDIALEAHIFFPEGHTESDRRPVHLNFYGGGWAMGMPEWSYGACKKAAQEGRVSITFDYRLRNVHGSNIKDAVSDALFAVAWVREHAKELGVDNNRILAEGFSAGGHLALMTTMVNNTKDFGVTSEYSSRPNALILGSTPYDVTFRDVYDMDYNGKIISPIYLIQDNLPPMFIYHGEKDRIVAFSEFERFIEKIGSTESDVQYFSIKNVGHFLNGASKEDTVTKEKMKKEFLKKYGFL